MYFIEVELTKLRNTSIETMEVEGQMEEGIFIPIKRNGLIMTKNKKVKLLMRMLERKPNPDGYTHTITPYMYDLKELSKIVELGWWRSMFYLGRAKPLYWKKSNYDKCKNVPIEEAMNKD